METELADLVTVVIPTIEERADLVAEAVESCLRQTAGVPAIEVRMDGEGGKERVGPAAVRNSIMDEVATPWAVFLDDDDILHPNYFERMVPHLKGPNGVVYSWCVEQGFSADLDRPFDANALRGANYIPVTACVKTELFRRVGGFPEAAIYEDWALWLKILDSGGKFKNVPEKLWTYRRHAGSRTHVNQHRIAMGESATGW